VTTPPARIGPEGFRVLRLLLDSAQRVAARRVSTMADNGTTLAARPHHLRVRLIPAPHGGRERTILNLQFFATRSRIGR